MQSLLNSQCNRDFSPKRKRDIEVYWPRIGTYDFYLQQYFTSLCIVFYHQAIKDYSAYSL